MLWDMISSPMSLESLLQTYFIGSLLLALLGLLLAVGMMGLWLGGLIHCLKYRLDRDRLVWVLVTLLGGPIGAIIYLCIGRPVRMVSTSSAGVAEGIGTAVADPFDHAGMQNSQTRALAIQETLWRDAAQRRRK